ncbi:MAG: 4a-hydroxytetrahydrobiopterin dehydratase, partial [Candidatus Aenigmatarchaeota archaeon]
FDRNRERNPGLGHIVFLNGVFMSKLSREAIAEKLEGFEGWELDSGRLRKKLEFEDFNEALQLVNEVGSLADKINHHPDMTLQNYNEVIVETTTHSEESITEKDFRLLEGIEDIS